MQTQSVTINFTGGIVSPGYLKDILEVAQQARVTHVRFGLRQQLIMEVPLSFFEGFTHTCLAKKIVFYKTKEALPNIVSSYPAAGIFTADSWMREGVYKDIFDSFNYQPQLKINICDSQQNFVPLFSGHINWVSSSSSQHFWFLYLRFPQTGQVYQWKEMVYTNDVPLLSRAIESEILKNRDLFYANLLADGDALFHRIKSTTTYIAKDVEAESLPDFSLPYYEGFNHVNNQLWLGIYRRDELFAVEFLLYVCRLCMQSRIGQFYTTPWKSIIIKNIDHGSRKSWDLVLGKFRINVRHAANELNWQVEDNTENGLQLKRHIIRHFDKEDVRTYGLCFAVQTKPTSSMFGSVVIRRQQPKNQNRSKIFDRYDILYRKDFNPNAGALILFREGVEKDFIGTYLVSLCKYFYEEQDAKPILQTEAAALPSETNAMKIVKLIHQCKHCYTVYEPAQGDAIQNIAPATAFEDLPETYCCSLCEAPKQDFVTVDESSLNLVAN